MKIFLIESIPLLREALVRQIQGLEHFSVVQAVGSLQNLPAALSECSADLLWLDGSLESAEAPGLVRKLRKRFPELCILVFGASESIPEIKAFFKEGVAAYLPKTATIDEIGQALACIAVGERYVPSSLHTELTAWLTDPRGKKKQNRSLTQREQEILQLIVEEYTTCEIAKKLFISQCTVETHRINMIQKLGVRNTAGLVRVAFETGLYSWSMV